MKKMLGKFNGSRLNRTEMKSVNGGRDNVYTCTAGNGAGFATIGNWSDVQTMVLMVCGPCTVSCVVC